MKQLLKSQIATTENQFTQTTFSLKRKMNWWREQSVEGDKGGSFNLNLYLDYLENQEFNEETILKIKNK
jgi:hypothetical protein